jgi:hypothetical protein
MSRHTARFPHVNLVWVISEVFPSEAGSLQAFLGHAPTPLVPMSLLGLEHIRQLNEQWQSENATPPNSALHRAWGRNLLRR